MKFLVFLSLLVKISHSSLYQRFYPYSLSSFSSYSNYKYIPTRTHSYRPSQNSGYQFSKKPQPQKPYSLRSMNSLFYKLPSSSQVDTLILKADSVAILKTIQKVSRADQLSCDERISYLQQMLGRMHSIADSKKLSANKKQIIIDGAKTEIDRLLKKITNLQQEKSSLRIDFMKNRLSESVKELSDLYFRSNREQYKIWPKRTQVLKHEYEIIDIKKNVDTENNLIIEAKLQLSQTQTEIDELKRMLSYQLQRQQYLQGNINESVKTMREIEEQIETNKDKIEIENQQIFLMKDRKDLLQSQWTFLQIQVQKLKLDIALRSQKRQQIQKQITENINKLNQETKKQSNKELSDLQSMIEELQSTQFIVEKQIDISTYQCFAENKQKVKQNSIFFVDSSNLKSYLRNSYGKQVVVPSTIFHQPIQKVNIFESQWINRYGTEEYNDFHCLNPMEVKHGYGIIQEISSSSIKVSDSSGKVMNIKLGFCSRLESNYKIPQIGDHIYWKGIIEENNCSLYYGTCIKTE